MEIVKRLNTLINQLVPFLQPDHQQQVVQAVDRAKQVTVQDLNVIIGVSCQVPSCVLLLLMIFLFSGKGKKKKNYCFI